MVAILLSVTKPALSILVMLPLESKVIFCTNWSIRLAVWLMAEVCCSTVPFRLFVALTMLSIFSAVTWKPPHGRTSAIQVRDGRTEVCTKLAGRYADGRLICFGDSRLKVCKTGREFCFQATGGQVDSGGVFLRYAALSILQVFCELHFKITLQSAGIHCDNIQSCQPYF